MTEDRLNAFWEDENLELTFKELKEGWHFCWEWDGLLVGPGMQELKACTCCDIKPDKGG